MTIAISSAFHRCHLSALRVKNESHRPAVINTKCRASSSPITHQLEPTEEEFDVVVIGAGIGGLCCAALLARYGLHVAVCESHTIPGGAAHAWQRNGFHFESGPSLYSGMASTGPGANPLALVLQAIDEQPSLHLKRYNEWNVIVPEAPEGALAGVGVHGFDDLLVRARGHEALREWRRLQAAVLPLTRAATALPPAALRLDPGVVLSAVLRYFPSLLTSLPTLPLLTRPFSEVMDSAKVTDPFVRNYVDLLCFLLSGLPADGTICAEVAFMFGEWFRPNAALEFPVGGSQTLVDALVRGVVKRGGEVRTGVHVEHVLVDDSGKKAVGVQLRGGGKLLARRSVVSNASTPDTLKLIPPGPAARVWAEAVNSTPLNPSFMHLHLGFDACGLESLGLHHIVVDSWDVGVTAPQNVVLISIPSVIDPGLAPPGKHVLHAYYPATEPWEFWAGLKRGSDAYRRQKNERAAPLWRAVERVIPDIKERIEVEMVGTPLTHARFLRRHRGSYGPAWQAGKATFPYGSTPLEHLYCCGDFTFPGIGEFRMMWTSGVDDCMN